jgi:hypothetical protein
MLTPDGSTQSPFVGERYARPGSGQLVFPITAFQDNLHIAVDGFSASVQTFDATLDNRNQITITNPGASRLTVRVTTTTGRFSGSIVLPGQTRPVSFGGVFLQSSGIAKGFASNPSQPTYITIVPSPLLVE